MLSHAFGLCVIKCGLCRLYVCQKSGRQRRSSGLKTFVRVDLEKKCKAFFLYTFVQF